jgi:hypothetical protein
MEFEGGATEAQAGEAAKAPHVDVRPLPAWGFFARNVKDLVLDDVLLSVASEDARPALYCERIEALGLDGVRLPQGVNRRTAVLKETVRVERRTKEYLPPAR